ncbi:hypothetical protein QQ045_030347 [Rhodiola kirilowii]
MVCSNKQKIGSMSLKLDMSKAYDRIEWRFLEKMMLSMGFSDCWMTVMLFIKARQDSIRWIGDVLKRYEAVSGQKANYMKSEGVCTAKELYKEKEVGGLGFRDLEQVNLALLAKQAWRILTKPDLLVSKVFKSKYFPNSDLFNATGGIRPSYAWRGIVASFDMLKRGIEWDVRDGTYRWRFDGSGELTVKSAYYAARELENSGSRMQGYQAGNGVGGGAQPQLGHPDSSEVIWAINMGVWKSGCCGSELRECIKVLEEHSGWSIGSINRDLNAVADWLAKRARMEKWVWKNMSAIPRGIPYCFRCS